VTPGRKYGKLPRYFGRRRKVVTMGHKKSSEMLNFEAVAPPPYTMTVPLSSRCSTQAALSVNFLNSQSSLGILEAKMAWSHCRTSISKSCWSMTNAPMQGWYESVKLQCGGCLCQRRRYLTNVHIAQHSLPYTIHKH
jgi:hypothetical protein